MSGSKHTAGPWFISKRYVVGPRDESDTQGFGMIVGVADVYGDNRNQDARLIAAAPDLLAALKACRLELDYCADQLAHHGRVGGENGSVATALRDAAGAIAKAEGRS